MWETECVECTIEAVLDEFSGTGYAIFPNGGDGIAPELYKWDPVEEEWNSQEGITAPGTIVCAGGNNYMYIEGVWYLIPSITSGSWLSDVLTVQGLGFPDSYIQVETSSDLGATWDVDSQIVTMSEFAIAGIDIPWLASEGNVVVRVRNFTLNCSYGYSSEVMVIV
jgi:restriction endonuclease S subunit